jgi:protein disulfide-isomerase A1
MTKYPLSQLLPVNLATVSAFVEEFVKGDLKPSIKSQAIPTTQEESSFIMVADSWDSVVAEDDKDLFLFIHAPWCGQYVSQSSLLTLKFY